MNVRVWISSLDVSQATRVERSLAMVSKTSSLSVPAASLLLLSTYVREQLTSHREGVYSLCGSAGTRIHHGVAVGAV